MGSPDQALARLRRLIQSMAPDTAPVDEALPSLRKLLDAAGVPFKLVGGLAVVHHGYIRMTDDIDVLVDSRALAGLDEHLADHGFERPSRTRLLHAKTGVVVDLLVEGDPRPRRGEPPYPSPLEVAASPRDSQLIDLAPLMEFKLRARRHQDIADVVALLKPIDDSHYVPLEASLPAELRPRLAALREDALEELRLAGG